MDRTDPQQLRERLHRAGAWSNKGLGQHYLTDSTVLADIMEASDVKQGSFIIEVGPGPGVLTERLLEAGARVVAFEADDRLAALVREDFPNVELLFGDAIKRLPHYLGGLQEAYAVVANIPYSITTPLLRVFLETEGSRRPESMTLLMQREVAERLAAPARTGERGYLSVLAQYHAEVTIVRAVGREAFWPEPSVRSSVINLKVRSRRPLPAYEEATFFAYVRSAFKEPRKQLKNVLAGIRGVPSAEMQTALEGLGLPSTVRAQELDQEQWLTLYRAR